MIQIIRPTKLDYNLDIYIYIYIYIYIDIWMCMWTCKCTWLTLSMGYFQNNPCLRDHYNAGLSLCHWYNEIQTLGPGLLHYSCCVLSEITLNSQTDGPSCTCLSVCVYVFTYADIHQLQFEYLSIYLCCVHIHLLKCRDVNIFK